MFVYKCALSRCQPSLLPGKVFLHYSINSHDVSMKYWVVVRTNATYRPYIWVISLVLEQGTCAAEQNMQWARPWTRTCFKLHRSALIWQRKSSNTFKACPNFWLA